MTSFGPGFLYMEALAQKAHEGRYDGHLSVQCERGEWCITLGGGRSDGCLISYGPTFEKAAQEALLRK